MKVELDDTTATTLFQALRAYTRQLAMQNATANEHDSKRLQTLWEAARAAEVIFVGAVLKAKEDEEEKPT